LIDSCLSVDLDAERPKEMDQTAVPYDQCVNISYLLRLIHATTAHMLFKHYYVWKKSSILSIDVEGNLSGYLYEGDLMNSALTT